MDMNLASVELAGDDPRILIYIHRITFKYTYLQATDYLVWNILHYKVQKASNLNVLAFAESKNILAVSLSDFICFKELIGKR